MQERWKRLEQKPEAGVEEENGVRYTRVYSFEEEGIELYYLNITTKNNLSLPDGVYMVLNRTPEELLGNDDLENMINSIASDEFAKPSRIQNSTYDLENIITGEYAGTVKHDGKNWSVLKLSYNKKEVITGLISAGFEYALSQEGKAIVKIDQTTSAN